MRPKTTTLAIVCAVAMAGLFGLGRQPSSGQDSKREPACGCFFCYGPYGSYGVFDDGKTTAGKPCSGILAEDACPQEMAYLPDKGKAFCQKIKAALKFTSFKDSCPALASACEPDEKKPPPEKKCEKPTPWFDPPSTSKCPVVHPIIVESQGTVYLAICGTIAFQYTHEYFKDPLLLEAYKAALRDWVKERIGSELCCEQFREAARSGTPCNPVADLDCDGIPNQTDVVSASEASFPDINNLFSRPEGAPIDKFPAGLDPDDPDFLPPSEKCDCKWELVKGTLNCSPDGKQRHFYEARWRCPSTGNERFTRKYAAPTAPCP